MIDTHTHSPTKSCDSSSASRRKRKTDEELNKALTERLGPGPMRFGPVTQERSVRTIFGTMEGHAMEKRVQAYANVKAGWQLDGTHDGFTDSQILRFVMYYKYDADRALRVMKRTDPRYFHLTSFELEDQLRSKTLFPVPGLKSMEGSDVVYMRPSRYFPKKTPTTLVIDNLVYALNSLAIKDPENKRGIAFVANMNDWKMCNFSTNYCYRFMQVLQGRVFCASVNLFLIVNPPKWFNKIWAIMKRALSVKFQQKVHMITEDKLEEFLKPGFEDYLPDEFLVGEANVDNLVNDFVAFQHQMERACGKLKKETNCWWRVHHKSGAGLATTRTTSTASDPTPSSSSKTDVPPLHAVRDAGPKSVSEFSDQTDDSL